MLFLSCAERAGDHVPALSNTSILALRPLAFKRLCDVLVFERVAKGIRNVRIAELEP